MDTSKTKPSKAVVVGTFIVGLTAATATNYLGAELAKGVSPLLLNGTRLLVGVALLTLVGVWFGLNLRIARQHGWKYVVNGLLNMGVPQALIFLALRDKAYGGARPIDVAIVEAGIPGLIFVYVIAKALQRKFSKSLPAVIAAMAVFAGLVIFLGVFEGVDGRKAMTAASWLLIVSAVATGIGLIFDDGTKWPVEPSPNREWKVGFIKKAEVTVSLKKALAGALVSGLVTLCLIPLLNPVLATSERLVVPSGSRTWVDIMILAVVGTCLTWCSIFLLIQMGQLILVAALVAGIPVATAAYIWLSGSEEPLRDYQLWGGAVLVVGLFALIYLQLLKSSDTNQKNTGTL